MSFFDTTTIPIFIGRLAGYVIVLYIVSCIIIAAKKTTKMQLRWFNLYIDKDGYEIWHPLVYSFYLMGLFYIGITLFIPLLFFKPWKNNTKEKKLEFKRNICKFGVLYTLLLFFDCIVVDELKFMTHIFLLIIIITYVALTRKN